MDPSLVRHVLCLDPQYQRRFGLSWCEGHSSRALEVGEYKVSFCRPIGADCMDWGATRPRDIENDAVSVREDTRGDRRFIPLPGFETNTFFSAWAVGQQRRDPGELHRAQSRWRPERPQRPILPLRCHRRRWRGDIGVYLSDSDTRNTQVGANVVGMAADGMTELGNAGRGVAFTGGACPMLIGGNGLLANTISGNGDCGGAHWHWRLRHVRSGQGHQ